MRPLLRVVDTETGEVHEGCPGCSEAERTLVQYEKDIRILKAKITKLERDIEIDARKDPLWDEGEGVFQWYALSCNHENQRFEAEELYLVKPHLKREGPIECLKAIAGAAYDPYHSELKNGRRKPNDAWEQIFRNKAKFQSFVEKAPGAEGDEREWRRWLLRRVEASLTLGVG